MTNRLSSPNIQFADQNGLPYAGGTLSFFQSGTSTPLSVFSDKALSISRGTIVTLDSAGRAGDVFLQNVAYKVVLADVNGVQIWTADPVYASDFSTLAQVQATNGSPNGQLAGTAGSVGVAASIAWDFFNQILYVCTQTGTAVTAIWAAVNPPAATIQIPVPAPQGYLTPTSQTPIIPSDVTGATGLFYTPYIGNIVPIFNGTSFTAAVFAELPLNLTSAHLANQIYDVFVFNNSGVISIATGPAWSNATAGSGSRGSGAGTTQLNRTNGILVNAVQIVGARNGSNTFTINTGFGTYVGSIFVDGSNGQVSFHRSSGQNRKWGAWNAYNRAPIVLRCSDPTASWTYGTATWRASNNAPATFTSAAFNVGSGTTCNGIVPFTGLAEEEVSASVNQWASFTNLSFNNNVGGSIGIGLNSVTAAPGFVSNSAFALNNTSTFITLGQVTFSTQAIVGPTLGTNALVSMENGVNSSGSVAFAFQGQSGMQLVASWRG